MPNTKDNTEMTDFFAIELESLITVTGGGSPSKPKFPPAWDCVLDPKTGKLKCKKYPVPVETYDGR